MILGNKIEYIPTAVQKAGRGAGIVRQCPQYSGEFHYWIDAETSKNIVRHYKKVDEINKQKGTNSILQARTRAEANLPPPIRHNHSVDLSTFRVLKGSSPENTLGLVKDIVRNIFHQTFRSPQKAENSNFYTTSMNRTSEIAVLTDAVKKVPGAYGTNAGQKTYRRFLPCYKDLSNESSLHIVIPLIDPSYTQEMKDRLDREYSQYFVQVPQEGDF
jgi:hypothetical protein